MRSPKLRVKFSQFFLSANYKNDGHKFKALLIAFNDRRSDPGKKSENNGNVIYFTISDIHT